jgi:hypothetical protein
VRLPEAVRKPLHEVKVSLLFAQYRLFKRGRALTFQGRSYPYLYARYNLTVRNERSIEIPIFWEAVGRYRPEQVLEVGNVLAHYHPIRHAVLDKYEVAPGVVNDDVVDFRPGRTYDLILAISTLEHVGWDESPRDPPKVGRAIERLRHLLAPGGRLMLSFPIGYNSEVDRLLITGAIPFSQVAYFKRVTPDNIWAEAPWDAVRGSPFNHRIPTATGLVIGVVDGPPAA